MLETGVVPVLGSECEDVRHGFYNEDLHRLENLASWKANSIIWTSCIQQFDFLALCVFVAELLRENKRMLDRSIRDIERERMQLQTQEKKLIAEIKKTAKQGQMVHRLSPSA